MLIDGFAVITLGGINDMGFVLIFLHMNLAHFSCATAIFNHSYGILIYKFSLLIELDYTHLSFNSSTLGSQLDI